MIPHGTDIRLSTAARITTLATCFSQVLVVVYNLSQHIFLCNRQELLSVLPVHPLFHLERSQKTAYSTPPVVIDPFAQHVYLETLVWLDTILVYDALAVSV